MYPYINFSTSKWVVTMQHWHETRWVFCELWMKCEMIKEVEAQVTLREEKEKEWIISSLLGNSNKKPSLRGTTCQQRNAMQQMLKYMTHMESMET